MLPPEQRPGLPRSRHLVFTSAGDCAHLHGWLRGRRDFDLWVTYYGDHPGRYKDVSDYYVARKGGKFPNLHHAWQQWRQIFERYEAIFLADDDIHLDGPSISRLFGIRAEHDLWLLQPAFDPRGKTSHPITRVRAFSFMRYTNFIEVGCPLFRRDKLDQFLRVYDPALIGWGVDWWFLHELSPIPEDKIAIIDAVPCFNPPEAMKGGQREIDRLQDRFTREQTWQRFKQQLGIVASDEVFVEYRVVRRPRRATDIFRSVKFGLINTALYLAKLQRRMVRRVAPADRVGLTDR